MTWQAEFAQKRVVREACLLRRWRLGFIFVLCGTDVKWHAGKGETSLMEESTLRLVVALGGILRERRNGGGRGPDCGEGVDFDISCDPGWYTRGRGAGEEGELARSKRRGSGLFLA